MDCIPISGRRGSFTSGQVTFSSGRFSIESEKDAREVMIQMYSSMDRGGIIPVLDVDSFRRKYLNPDIVKDLRVKGRRVWLISYIRSSDDVIDAMCGMFDRLCVPFHTIDDPDVLVDALDLSDCVLPTIFVSNGEHIGDTEMTQTIETIRDCGYYEYATLDVDSLSLELHAPFTDAII